MDLKIPALQDLKIPRLQDLKVPGLQNIKVPSLSKIAAGLRKVLVAVWVVVALIAIAFVGWTLIHDYNEDREVAIFAGHVAASEADLSLIHEKISAHMQSRNTSIAEADAYTQEFAAIAEYGRAVTAYHRQVISADSLPKEYAGVQSAYIRALDNLNRAFSLWSSAATAYDLKEYTVADRNLAEADQAWREYIVAVMDYNRELRAAEGAGRVPTA